MSLLMDALKRAEASKQKSATPEKVEAASELTGLTLEPQDNGERSTPLPDLAAHLDAVDADLEASASLNQSTKPAQSPPPSFVTAEAGQQAARTMFAAKSSPAAAEPSRSGLWILVAGSAVAAVAIGAYFWWQLTQLNAPPKATVSPVSTATQPIQPPASSPSIPVPRPTAQVIERTESSADPIERAASAAALTRGRLTNPDLQSSAPETIPNTRIQLSRSRPQTDPALMRGWRQLEAGALDAARKEYEQVLRNDPKNVDALLGMAVIAQRQGKPADAEQYYQEAFEADPKDAAAQAAVIGMATPSDPAAIESRLKTALAGQPDSPGLNFALGNLYAREQRWSEAQQAYFNAVAADADNPDYLFNLAVSLDQLRQTRLAAEHYQKALAAAAKRPAAFDRERANRRVGQLTGSP